MFDEPVGGLHLVMIVVSHQLPAQAKAGQHRARRAGVLAGYQIHGAEQGAGALGQVRQISDRRRDDVEMTRLGDQ